MIGVDRGATLGKTTMARSRPFGRNEVVGLVGRGGGDPC
jgi:hypothetical protein